MAGTLFIAESFRQHHCAQEVDTIRKDLHKVLQPNGLTLNEDTLRDGNCGLDAALRGFAFVENPNNEMRGILESLAKRGSQADYRSHAREARRVVAGKQRLRNITQYDSRRVCYQ